MTQLLTFSNLPNELRDGCFKFFYCFSRFEFALKENGYVTRGPEGSVAVAWSQFRDSFAAQYELTDEARELLLSPPQRQTYSPPGYDWEVLDLSKQKSNLGKVVLVLKTIRNNLFHGGKHSQKDWDDPQRNIFLLTRATKVLDSLAALDAVIGSDYERIY